MKKSVRTELDLAINELKMNLENNYKDLAHDALKNLHTVLENFHADGMLKEREYNKYKKIVDDYSAKMADYHH